MELCQGLTPDHEQLDVLLSSKSSVGVIVDEEKLCALLN